MNNSGYSGMKINLSLLLITSLFFTVSKIHAQPAKLYYFITKDSLVGVKDQKGKIIILPRESLRYAYEDTVKPITDKVIYMDAHPGEAIEPHSWGSAYSREGKFLFAPFTFDNGPDYFSEGLTRFVKDKKIGFANRDGEIVIAAKYDYADAFNYGTAWYCNGCTWKYRGEHAFVSGGYNGYINKKGDTLAIIKDSRNKKDQPVDSTGFLPYQYAYSPLEQKIVDSFYRLPSIAQSYFVNYVDNMTPEEKQLHYEIAEKPRPSFPYYRIAVYNYSKRWGYRALLWEGMNFAVSADGKDFYFLDYDDTKTPLQQWLQQNEREARAYLKDHPEMPNRF